jgi:S1-C subfamily serine protease
MFNLAPRRRIAAFSGFLVFGGLVMNLLGAEADRGAKKLPDAAPGEAGKAVERSVVKVFATSRQPDFYKPWTKQAPADATGSGVVIEGKRILSNAHVVNYASQVQVQANESGEKISATVEVIAPGIDLAVLKLDDDLFFDNHPPLPRASALPAIKDSVMAYGFPQGGTSLSITRGIVSRIEFVFYNYTVAGLRIQIDAAINPGNSGGPAVVGEKMIGLAFSHLGQADNIGYIIPCEEIELFLQDIRDGRYDGKPGLFDDLQTLENPALYPFLKLDKSVEGIIVNIPYRAEADYPLKKWDLITKIGEASVDRQGMIKVGSDLRLSFRYLAQKIVTNGKVPLTVVRQGKPLEIELPVSPTRLTILPALENKYPDYFVFGPVAFSSASSELVSSLARSSHWIAYLAAMENPLLTRMGEKPAFEGQRLVVVPSPFFPHKLAKGYSSQGLQVVKSINGQSIKNLPHLVQTLRDSREEFITIEFAGKGETLVLPRQETLTATDDILTDNGVRSQGSPDMLAIWNSKAPN